MNYRAFFLKINDVKNHIKTQQLKTVGFLLITPQQYPTLPYLLIA